MPKHLGRHVTALRVAVTLLLALLILDSVARPTAALAPSELASSGQFSAASPAGRVADPLRFDWPAAAHAQPVLPAPQPRQGALPFLTVLCRFPDVADEPEPPAFFARLLGESYPGLADYWHAVSYGAISLAGSSVMGWYSLPQGRAAYLAGSAAGRPPGTTADLQRLAEDCTAAVDAPLDWPRYAGINLVFNADLDQPHGGQVCLRRAEAERCYAATWMWPASLADQAMWAHEMGHAFGLRHSSLDTTAIYDNAWDVMSDNAICIPDAAYRRIGQEPLAFDKDLLGWIPAGRKYLATPNGEARITLERLAQPGPEGYLLAQVPISDTGSRDGDLLTHFYTLEARRFAGYDRNLPAEAVVIHEVDLRRETPARPVPSQPDGPGDTGGMWAPDSLFRDREHGIAVAIEAATATGFVVDITTQRRPWPLAPADHALVPVGAVSLAWEPVPGAAGFDLELAAASGQAGAGTVTETVRSAGYTATLAPGSYTWRVRALSADGAGPWTAPRNLLVGRLGAASPPEAPPPLAAGQVSTAGDRRGGVYAIWAGPGAGVAGPAIQDLQSALRTDIYAAYRPAGGDWGPAIRINDDPGATHAAPSIAVDAGGNAHAIWTATGPDGDGGIYAAYRPYGASNWSQASRVNDDHGSLTTHMFPALAVDGQGDAYASWIDDRTGVTGVYFAYRPRAAAGTAGGWSANISVSSDPLTASSPPSLAADAEGNAYLAWRQDRPCRGVDILFRGRTATGAWGPVTRVAANRGGQTLNWPGLALDNRGAVYAVWQEHFGANGRVYAARCGPRCGLPEAGAPSWGSAALLGRAGGPGSGPAWRLDTAKPGVLCVAWPLDEHVAGQSGCLALDALDPLPAIAAGQ